MLKQLSIFAENKKGTMQQITQILFENDVNILGSVNNDSAEYGIVRMVVSDPDKAEQALQAAGYMTRQTDVLGVEVVDQPGNLNSLLKTLLETNIDIDYIYLSFNRWRDSILHSFGYDPLKCPSCGTTMLFLELYFNHKPVPLHELYEKAMRKYRCRSPAPLLSLSHPSFS